MKNKRIKTCMHKLNRKIIDVEDGFLEYLLTKQNQNNNNDDDNYQKNKQIKLFIFIIKLAEECLPEEQKKTFIKYWVIDRGEKKFLKSHKTLQGNFMNLKLATNNIIKIIKETDYKDIIERYLNKNENKQ